jgi:TatD DNase family protein
MMNLIDTHFHLDHYKNYLEIAKTITEKRQYTICVTNSPGVFLSCKNIMSETKYLKFAIGFHPQESALNTSDMRDFTRLIRLTNYVGEIGLDYTSKSYMNRQQQLRFFTQIVEICVSENKLMTIHLRKAEEDAISILEKFKPNKAIIHWYTGNRDNMLRLVDLGCYFSVNANMVNSRDSEKYHLLPRERLLIESDGPYTKVNGRKYNPLLLQEAYEKIAKFYGNPDLVRDVYENFKNILSV